jgi:Uma2 family endonuclease
MKPNPITGMSREEYLAFERASFEKHEYRGGEIVAMSGAKRNHNIIAWDLGGELRNKLKGRDCRVYPGDLRVFLPREDLYAYPDLVVVCGKPEFQDEVFDTLLNPVLIIEILSETTEAYDRGDKSQAYRSITTLNEYALVSQDRMHIEK